MDYTKKLEDIIQACKKFDTNLAILSADTDQVKSYVYASTKLPEMRGASIILDDLNRVKLKALEVSGFKLEEGTLFNKGGSVLALVPACLTDAIKEEVERLYPSETHGVATITAVSELVEIDALKSKLDIIIKRLSNRLKYAKEQRCLFPVSDIIPLTRPCSSCGVRPANHKRTAPDIAYLCLACNQKRERGEYQRTKRDSGKTVFFRRFGEMLNHCPKVDTDRILQGCYEFDGHITNLEQIKDRVSHAKDLKEISDSSGYVGVIYADGNEIGAKLERLPTPELFMEFSDKLYQVAETSVHHALAKHIYPKPIRGEDERIIFPFELISIGGDDVFLIVPGDIALQVATRLCESFETGVQKSGISRLEDATLSAGVVIAKENFPVYYTYTLVEQLLKSAKKKAKSDGENIQTAIDFMVLKSEGGEVSNISEYRKALTREEERNRSRLELTCRPYLLADMQELIKFVRRLNREKFPRSRLYAMRKALETSKANSTLQYLYLVSRSNENFRGILRDYPQDSQMPWEFKKAYTDGYKEFQTPLVDILEILDFVKGEEPDETGS